MSQQRAEVRSEAAFCEAGAHFEVGEGELLPAADRLRYITAMAEEVTGPADLVHAFEHVLHTFEVRAVDETSEAAGVLVGEYIERTCPGVNVGGARG